MQIDLVDPGLILKHCSLPQMSLRSWANADTQVSGMVRDVECSKCRAADGKPPANASNILLTTKS